MISVESLSKRFADNEAVRAVSFHVEKGEILGFLGPNAAGKTTTMRMLTCYVPPSSGTASVAGWDIREHPVEVRRQVGYLPENVPLYGEMRVQEYLEYRARLKGVPRSRLRSRTDAVVERCGLGEARRRIIDQLSKGFRQRVGLAEALIATPPILILDEPTVGLDPQQIRQVRELIRDLGREHTILLSSHILPEVEQVCERVAIINRGRIVAEERTDLLREEMGARASLEVELRGERSAVLEALERIPGAHAVVEERAPAGGADLVRARIDSDKGIDLREPVFRLAIERGWVLLHLSRRGLSLEEVFIDLTARDDAPPDAGREADGGLPPSGPSSAGPGEEVRP